MKASDPQMTLGPGPCRGTGPFCGFPSVRPRQCQRATWASASEAGPAPSLFLTPFASPLSPVTLTTPSAPPGAQLPQECPPFSPQSQTEALPWGACCLDVPRLAT